MAAGEAAVYANRANRMTSGANRMTSGHLDPTDLPVFRVLSSLKPEPRRPVSRASSLPSRVEAMFTTRRGGVSGGPYASLNLAYAVGDSPEAVAENRRRTASVFGARLEAWSKRNRCTEPVSRPWTARRRKRDSRRGRARDRIGGDLAGDLRG